MDAQNLIQAALSLPESQRVVLLERLLESLSPSDEPLDSDKLVEELQRRLDEFKKDSSVAIPWEQVRLED